MPFCIQPFGNFLQLIKKMTRAITSPLRALSAGRAARWLTTTQPHSRIQNYPHQCFHQEPLGWNRVNRPRYSRPFDGFESVFHSICHDTNRPGVRSLDIFFTVGIETDREPQHVVDIAKKAWKRMRYVHPALAAEAVGSEFRYAALTDPSSVHEWVEKSFVVNDSDADLGDAGHHDFNVAPSTQIPTLYYFPRNKRFVFRSNHIHTDGHGVLLLFQDFFAEIARLDSGGSEVNDPLGYEVQNLPSAALDSAKPIIAAEDAFLPKLKSTGEAFKLPSPKTPSNPGKSRGQTIEFSREETTQFRAVARNSGLRFTPLIHATFLHAGRKIAPCANNTTHTGVLIFNFRDMCRGSPVNVHARASALRIGFWPFQVQMADDLPETASRFKREYVKLATEKAKAIHSMVPYLETATEELRDEMTTGILPSFIGDLSNRVLDKYGSFKIKDLWGVAVPTDARVYLGIQTFGHKLSIRAAYDAAFHDDQQVARYLELIKLEIQGVLSRDFAS